MRLVEKETLCRAFWQGVGTVAHPSQVGGETSCPEALQVTLALEPPWRVLGLTGCVLGLTRFPRG